MPRVSFAFALAVLAVAVAGCGTLTRAGRSASESVAQAGLALGERLSGDERDQLPPLPAIDSPVPVELVYEQELTGEIPDGYPRLQPAFTETLVVAAHSRTELRAYHLNERRRVWTAELPEAAIGGIGYAAGLVLVGTAEGHVLAVAAKSGEPAWTGQVSSEVVAPPVGDESVIVAASGDGQLTGLSAVDGARKWSFGREVPALSLRGGATPLVTGGLVVHGFPNGHLVAAALHNGLEAWDTPIALPRGRTELERMVDVRGAPIERNGTVFAAAFQGRIAAVGLQSGEQIWSRELSSFQPLAADDFNVYATDADGTLWAFDQRTGLTYWEQDGFQGRRPTAPAVLGPYLVFGDALGDLHLLSADSGKPVARVDLGDDPFAFQPTVRNGVALLYSTGGRLYAVRPALRP